jgi:hypothetical protein
MNDTKIEIELLSDNTWQLTMLEDGLPVTKFVIKRHLWNEWNLLEGEEYINSYANFETCLYVAYSLLMKE